MAVQVAGLRSLFPQGNTILNKNSVSWFGKVATSDYSRTYTLELRYKQGATPKVWVREPDLKVLASDRRLPHVYDQMTQELCLYLPGCGFWTPQKSVAFTIMQWASLWLFYFEIWLVTNEWCGRGEHPHPKSIAA